MCFGSLVADFPFQILIFRLDFLIVVQQLIMLFLEIELVSVGNFVVCSILFVAICFYLQSLVFIVEVVETCFLCFDFTFEVIDSILVLVEV